MKLFRKILLPFVPVYYLVTWLRNKCFNWGFLVSYSFDIPIVTVGNLSTGGTGKTPMVEQLIRYYSKNYNTVILSRGYKRKTKGFFRATQGVTVEQIGDEPLQFYQKYGATIEVVVHEKRVEGVKSILKLWPNTELIILDDAYQHRSLKPKTSILLTSYDQPYFKDFVLPTGNLREPRRGAIRADFIVVTKCPVGLKNTEKKKIKKSAAKGKHQKVFFSHIEYHSRVISETERRPIKELENFALVTGIANPSPLISYLTKKGLRFTHFGFNDHHQFTAQDLIPFSAHSTIVTTEKDYMRLQQYETIKDKLYYLPIQSVISDEEKFFKELDRALFT